jgi:anti-sigma regulatory factor (Ser/Thr protein kinase)
VDLFFDATSSTAVTELRAELSAYFRRHAAAGSDLDGAEIAVTELMASAVKHAPGPAWIHVDWAGRRPRVEVHELGPGFELRAVLPSDPPAAGGRGLFIVSHLTQDLAAAAKRAGGSRVSAVLPIERAVEHSRMRSDALPTARRPMTTARSDANRFYVPWSSTSRRPSKVRPDQTPPSEPSPRSAPTSAGAWRTKYRRAWAITEQLRAEQIADLYIRLKAAIGGEFSVIEADDEKIVLANRACPFGEVVKRAPGLCRMTSSVFGGIAARNTGGAAVVLEERGRRSRVPCCRVARRRQAWPLGSRARLRSVLKHAREQRGPRPPSPRRACARLG